MFGRSHATYRGRWRSTAVTGLATLALIGYGLSSPASAAPNHLQTSQASGSNVVIPASAHATQPTAGIAQMAAVSKAPAPAMIAC